LLEIAVFMGLALASTIEAMLSPKARRSGAQSGTGDDIFAAGSTAVAAYAATRGFTIGPDLSDADRQSVFLGGDSANITPVLRGVIRGCGFTWYQTSDDVYAIQLGKTFPHVFVRSRLNPDNRGLSAGHIGDVTPITLEADFGRYFTAYAPGADAQIDTRELLTPDIMLTMLLTAPTADFEFLDGTLFVSFPQTAGSEASAYAEITALEPIIGQLLEGNGLNLNLLSPKFRPPRFHINLGHLADKATFTLLKLVGLFFLTIILGSAANNLPKIGSDVSMVLIIIAVAFMVLCAVLSVGLVYAAMLYATFSALRSLLIKIKVGQLSRAYRLAYAQAP
jgi:hypothetical protein